jgi:hypothetical protein
MTTTFGEVQLGEAFVFFGWRYVKTAPNMSEDHRGWGHVLRADYLVEVNCELHGPLYAPGHETPDQDREKYRRAREGVQP